MATAVLGDCIVMLAHWKTRPEVLKIRFAAKTLLRDLPGREDFLLVIEASLLRK